MSEIIEQLPLLGIGHHINFSGIILHNNKTNKQFLLYFPNIEEEDLNSNGTPVYQSIHMDLDSWTQVTKQMDMVQTEILAEDEGKIVKTMFRKSQRIIDRRIQWSVFARDNFKCRYTGQTGIPLTVDHIDLWEKGGATIPENLLTSSHKANKLRGNIPYEEWIVSPEYARISRDLTPAEKEANLRVVDTLPSLRRKRQIHKRKR